MVAVGTALFVVVPSRFEKRITNLGRLSNLLYAAALGRRPPALEREAALEMVGDPMRSEGVEDFLWVVRPSIFLSRIGTRSRTATSEVNSDCSCPCAADSPPSVSWSGWR